MQLGNGLAVTKAVLPAPASLHSATGFAGNSATALGMCLHPPLGNPQYSQCPSSHVQDLLEGSCRGEAICTLAVLPATEQWGGISWPKHIKDAGETRTRTQALKLPDLWHAVCDCLQSLLALPAALLVYGQA